MNERYQPNTFKRLAQGKEAKLAQIETARGLDDEEILVLDTPKTTFFSKLKKSLSIFFKPASRRVAVPVGMVLLTIAAACSGAGKDKQGDVGGSEDFSDNLPIELLDACRSFKGSETIGGEGDILGYTIAARYFLDNPADNRALYMSASGAAFNFRLDLAKQAFEKAVELGLPDKQEQLAKDMVRAIDKYNDQTDPVEAFDAVLEPMGNLRQDLEENICRQAKSELLQPDDKDGQITPTPEVDFAQLISCAAGTNYPEFVDCRDELIQSGEESIQPLLNEMLREDKDHTEDSGYPLYSPISVGAEVFVNLSRQNPEVINEAIEKILKVLECSSISQCGDVEIDGRTVAVAPGDILNPIGKNALASIKEIGFTSGGETLVTKHISVLKQIQQWTEAKITITGTYVEQNNNLKELIFHLEN